MNEDYMNDDDLLDNDSEDQDIDALVGKPSKAWRAIERYREMKQLRQNLDDYLFDFDDNSETLSSELKW